MAELIANDPWSQSILLFQFYASVAALIFLIARWRRKRTLLQYEPRRPVPWGVGAALVAVGFTAVTIVNAFAAEAVPKEVAKLTPNELVLNLVAWTVVQSLGPLLLLFIAAMSMATWTDVGLPSRSAAAWLRDIAIGVCACFASIIPVGLVNIATRVVMKVPDEFSNHPLVETLINSEPNLGVVVLSIVVAVVGAPIAEELTFRLLLQGWLEKWEDRRLGWRRAAIDDSLTDETAASEVGLEAQPEPANDIRVDQGSAAEPPRTGIGGLPYGWMPIILSSLMFAAAHYGHGPDPVPLFALALVLGYCYQRTHRIIPSIVAHGLFNLISMIALWRIVFITPR